jgi:hypothetical protein
VTYALDMADRLGLAERFSPEIKDYPERISMRTGYKVADEKSPH